MRIQFLAIDFEQLLSNNEFPAIDIQQFFSLQKSDSIKPFPAINFKQSI